MNPSWKRKKPTAQHRRVVEAPKPQALFSLDEIDRLVLPTIFFIAVHVAAGLGVYLWLSGHRELAPDSVHASLNGSEWTRFAVTLHNFSVRQTCERCCMNGRVTTSGHTRLGDPAWERHVRYTIHSTPVLTHTEIGRECTKPKLANRCEPTPCSMPGGVWCFNNTCDGKLLWRPPHDEFKVLHNQDTSNVFFGPLLLVPAAFLDLYLIGACVHRLLFSSYRRMPRPRGSSVELQLGADTPTHAISPSFP